MKVFQKNGRSVSLTQKDFIAGGGEGRVFGKKNRAYKIYNDPAKMIPSAKIDELKTLSRDHILVPKEVVFNEQNIPIGFTMDWIRQAQPLCRLFTNDFRDRHRITPEMTVRLVETMKETIAYIHQRHCLIVDGNEFNYLVDDRDFTQPYFIDVDSYQTPRFPATAVMNTILDPLAQKFTALSDWFGFAIVACQLFVGIHPFKGRHPGYHKHELERRMKDHVSIFNPAVSCPPATRDFNLIPAGYRDWFTAMFEAGKRVFPPRTPSGGTRAAIVLTSRIKKISQAGYFDIKCIREFPEPVLRHRTVFGMGITFTRSRVYIDHRGFAASPENEVVFSRERLAPVLVSIEQGYVKTRSLDGRRILAPVLKARKIMVIENTLYIKNEDRLSQVVFVDQNEMILQTVSQTWPVMPHSAEVFDGLLIQNVLGQPFLVIPIPEVGGRGRCIVKPLPELEACRIISAGHDNGVVVIHVHKDGKYHRLIIKFDALYKKYNCRMIEDIDPAAVNFVTLTNGITVMVTDEGLEVFDHRYDRPDIKQIDDATVNGNMKLSRDHDRVLYYRENKLYRLSMKKTGGDVRERRIK